jgi:hypothetical protein
MGSPNGDTPVFFVSSANVTGTAALVSDGQPPP